MSIVTIWHNPGCGSSKNALNDLLARGVEPVVYQYLKERPSRDTIEDVLARLQISAKELLRPDEAKGEELNLYRDDVTDDEIITAMVAHPKLIQRPIVITAKGAVIARPRGKIAEELQD
jgi:arsenate reductase